MRATLNLDFDDIQPWSSYLSKRSKGIWSNKPVTFIPNRLIRENGLIINVIPSLTKTYGDYKFVYKGQVVWVFKEFIEPEIRLSDEDLEIDI